MSESSDRPWARFLSGRRPLPALIALVVLAVAAIAVWWTVLRQDAAMQQAAAAACSSAEAAPQPMDPSKIELRVYNATATGGLATTVANALRERGFTVAEVANDPHPELPVSGVGELRFGNRGRAIADYVGLLVPGATDRPDTRATEVVDVVIGPDFQELASADAVTAALASTAQAEANC